MASKQKFLSDIELQQEVEAAAEEMRPYTELDMSDVSVFSDSDADPTYLTESDECSEDDEPKKRKRSRKEGAADVCPTTEPSTSAVAGTNTVRSESSNNEELEIYKVDQPTWLERFVRVENVFRSLWSMQNSRKEKLLQNRIKTSRFYQMA
nr:unnamed protein product [Callosobruchus chinensis]